MGRTVLPAVMALVLALSAAPAYAETSPRAADGVPDYGSSEDVPSNPDYQITDDGYLIYQGDIVVPCESVRPENYTASVAFEEQAGICERAGFPPGELPPSEWVSLPTTGGVSPLLAPVAFILLAAWAFAHATAPR